MTSEKIGEINGTFAKLFKLGQVLGPVVTAVLVAGIGWIINQTDGIKTEIGLLKTKIAVIESRIHLPEEDVGQWRAIADIREKIAKLPDEYPPKWFLDRVDRIENNLDRLAEQMLELSRIVKDKHENP